MEVHQTLGPGFLEGLYERALVHEFRLRGIAFGRQVPLQVTYKDVSMGRYRIDCVVDQKIIVEIKAVSAFCDAHISQAQHYLAATGLRLALLINFGAKSLQVKRVIM